MPVSFIGWWEIGVVDAEIGAGSVGFGGSRGCVAK
jgi:hypothetical protein